MVMMPNWADVRAQCCRNQDEEEAIPVTATEYVIAARSLHAKSTAAQAKKALQNALQHIQGMEQVCSEPEEWFTEYEPHVRRLPGALVPSFQPVRAALPAHNYHNFS